MFLIRWIIFYRDDHSDVWIQQPPSSTDSFKIAFHDNRIPILMSLASS